MEQLYYSYFIVWQSDILDKITQINPGDVYPMIETVNGVNRVVGPGKGSVSLPDYLDIYKNGGRKGNLMLDLVSMD
jgi:hypothetical protein